MELSAFLLKRFAMLTNDSGQSSTSTTAYGTIKVDGDSTYVMLDGASSLTAISEATDVRNGDRVLVSIENHVATIVGNLTCPASGRTAVEVSEELADYQKLIVVEFEAVQASIEELTANQITTTYLDATYATITDLTAYKADITELIANYATIDDLTAAKATITDLTAQVATIEKAYIDEATVTTLLAKYATIENLNATNAAITNLSTVYATIDNLDAATANISDLTAEVANINSVLAGNIGAGTIQTVHLTADNVVIDDAVITSAMIADLSASKLTAGTIYTSLVRIANDTGENLLIDGATLQIKDANGTYRIQMGEDGDGNYSYYLWDAAGNLIFDALGAYALHDSIIKDVNVADDANINQSKIDMASVAERLNTDGSITVSAANVTIDNTTLDYKLSSMTTATAEAQAAADAAAAAAEALESEAVIKITQYYAVNDSASTPPGSGVAAAIVGTSVVEGCQVGTSATATSSWTTVYPTVSEGEYLWTVFFIAYVDGSCGWTTPTCLSDGVARESISTLVTELAVVQGQITAKVWQTDIDTAVDTLNGTITTLQDQYATVTQTVNGIETEIGDLTTTVTENYETLDGKITIISETADGITATVSSLQNTVNSNYSDLSSKITAVEATASGISATVSDLQNTVSSNYTDLSSKITAVETTASGISATVSDLETTVSGNYTDLSDKIAALTVTTDNITATVSDLETTVADNYTVLSDKISSLAVTADDITASVSSVQSQVTDLSATLDSSVQTSTAFFVIGDSDEAPPYEPGEAFAPSYVGTAAVGAAIVDGSDSGGWTTERLTAGEGEYLWMCYRLEYHDGTTVWTTPVCLTDDYTRTSVASLVLTTNSITARVTQTESDISANAASITTITGELSLKVDKNDNDQIVSMLNASADVITLTSNRLVIDSDNFSLTAEGNITATSGMIGGWSITGTRLQSSATISLGKEESGILLINEDGKPYIHAQDDTGHTTFRVTRTGVVYIDNGFRMYCPAEDAWVKALYFTGEDDAVLMIDYTLQVSGGVYTTGAVNCNALICENSAAFTGEVTMYGDVSVNGYAVPRILHGYVSVTVAASSTTTGTITFSDAFPGKPSVVLTVMHDSGNSYTCRLRTVSASSFTYTITSGNSSSTTPQIHWIAMYG